MSTERRDEIMQGFAKTHSEFLKIKESEEWATSLQVVVEWAEEEFMTSIHVHGDSHICFMDFSREEAGMRFIKRFFNGYVRVLKNHAMFPECIKNGLGYPVREEVEIVELSEMESDRNTITKESSDIDKEEEVEEMEKDKEIEALDAELTMLKKLLRLEVGEKRFTKVLQALEILK